MEVSLYVICCFSLAAFNILFLSLIFVSLITMCLSVFLLGFILPGTLCFLDLVDYFLSHIRSVFSYYLFMYFFRSFLSSPSGTTIMWMLMHLMFSKRVSGCFHFSPFFVLLQGNGLHCLSFCLPVHLSVLPQLLWDWILLWSHPATAFMPSFVFGCRIALLVVSSIFC